MLCCDISQFWTSCGIVWNCYSTWSLSLKWLMVNELTCPCFPLRFNRRVCGCARLGMIHPSGIPVESGMFLDTTWEDLTLLPKSISTATWLQSQSNYHLIFFPSSSFFFCSSSFSSVSFYLTVSRYRLIRILEQTLVCALYTMCFIASTAVYSSFVWQPFARWVSTKIVKQMKILQAK